MLMKLRRLRFGLAAVAVAATALMAQAADAAPHPWYVAGDGDGALGHCDPAVFGKSIDQAASWIPHSVFATTLPCGSGGQINSLAVAPSGRVFAGGYRYAANGHKQGLVMDSDDGGTTWHTIRTISASTVDTEFIRVAVTARPVGNGTVLHRVIAWTGTAANSVVHDVNGPFHELWYPVTDSPTRPGTRYLGTADNSDTTGSLVVAGRRTIALNQRCGVIGTLDMGNVLPRLFDLPLLNACVANFDVSLESVAANPSTPALDGVSVGTATQAGTGERPVVHRFDQGTGGPPQVQTQLLPGSGRLHAVAFGEGTSTAAPAWVAVGSKTVTGTEVGTAFRSTNGGMTWAAVTLPTGVKKLREVVYTGTKYLAVGDGGQVLTSVTGSTWTFKSSPASSVQSLRTASFLP